MVTDSDGALSPSTRSALLLLLHDFVSDRRRLDDVLASLVEIATSDSTEVVAVGVTMGSEDGRPVTKVCTDDSARVVDEAQYAADRGPCLDAWRHGQPVLVSDVATAADRYPEYARAAASSGIGATLSLPLIVGDLGVGALNIYTAAPLALTDSDIEPAAEVSSVVAVTGQGDPHGNRGLLARPRLRPPSPAVPSREPQAPGDRP